MIEYGFNFVNFTIKNMTDFFETRVEKLEPRQHKKQSSTFFKKSKDKKALKKSKRNDSKSSVL